MYIKLDDIIPNRFQPREVFDEEALNRLADSIRQHGVIEPILVRPVSNKYEIVAGERRYKASVLAGLTKIPAMVRQLDDKESSIVAFIENEHRSDVSAVEEARTMDRILKNNNMTQEELAKELGVNQSTIANKLRLLNLPLEVQDALMHNEISERHARSLLSIKNEDKQIEMLHRIKEKRMTVRELDSEIKGMNENMNNNEQPNMINDPATETVDVGFMDFLNKYDMNNPVQQEPVAPEAAPVQEDPNFMNFLNEYDAKNPLPQEPAAPEAAPVQEDPNFMNFLNEYDAKNPVPQEPAVPEAAPVQEDPNFMSFLNKYDTTNPLPNEEPEGESDGGFMNFLNNYDNNAPLPETKPEEPPVPATDGGNIYDSFNSSMNNNVIMDNVTPPVTDFSNQYIENTAGYVDVSKQEKITSVNTVIDKLKDVITDIKEKSVFKVDTDEVDYDDIYQITIKIDKRDF